LVETLERLVEGTISSTLPPSMLSDETWNRSPSRSVTFGSEIETVSRTCAGSSGVRCCRETASTSPTSTPW
jgi:hypothetical protein